MRTFDFSPLFRSTVGFDRLLGLLDAASKVDSLPDSYPPYDIEKLGEDSYRIALAVAGFQPDDLEISAQANLLTVTGKRAEDDRSQYLHRGLAGRSFIRRFELADFVKVTEANLENGLLSISLTREVPEAMKPRTIAISTGPVPAQIDHKAADHKAAA